MDDNNKPYKTLKELCLEVGLKPIPYVPVLTRPNYNIPKTDRKKRVTTLGWACVCGWIGKRSETVVKDKRMYCPKCNGPAGYDVFPSSGSTRKQ
jgi:hypothetical protein